MPDPFEWIADELQHLSAAGLLRERRCVVPLPRGRCRIGETEYWDFASNDYLGLAGDERVREAAAQAARNAPIGARASALVTGRSDWHARLERRLADFKGTDDALLFPSGYAANVGTLTALAGRDDVVFSDRLNHASLIDGARACGAKFQVYPHNDVDTLRRRSIQATGFRRRFIVTDSLFSMDGDAAPLPELASLADECDAILIVDEAHATGVFGDRGTGLVEASGAPRKRIVSVGTLSKAIGAQGGFVAGPQSLIDWLWNRARTQVFSTALARPVCAGAMAAIDVIVQEQERRRWLHQADDTVRREFTQQGWNIPSDGIGPIIPIVIGSPESTLRAADWLREAGLFVAAIRPPTVPRGSSRLRVSLSFSHGEEGIAKLLDAFRTLRSAMPELAPRAVAAEPR